MHFPKGHRKLFCIAILLAFSARAEAQTSTNVVVVSFSTTNTTALNLGFAGFSTEILDTGLEYDNPTFQQLAGTLSPGWLRYPGGTSDDAFNWSTGLTDTNWINEIIDHGDASPASSCAFTYEPLLGKGGAQFTNFAKLCENAGGAKIIAIVNAFTDNTNSAYQFAAFALSNHIPVAAWELCNEPYLFTGTNDFFAGAADYATQMLPFRNAIKAADSNAVVAVFYDDPATSSGSWDNALGKYTNKYWDAVSYHYYPQPALTNFADLMAYDNGVLFSNTSSYVSNNVIASNNPGVTYMVSEFQPVQGNGAGTGSQAPNFPSMTLYGGIYASEFIMRMSTVPQMKYVGNFQLFNQNGICATNLYRSAVTTAATNGYVTNTMNLPFGFYLSAQICGESVAYWAINRSTALYATGVGTNGPTVPMDTNGIITMPALYAQAYRSGNGKRYVVLTNKGSNAVPVQLMQDGAALTNSLLETFVTGNDPSLTNSSPTVTPVQIQSQAATNPVTIPEYSVVRLEWTAFTVPPPTVKVTVSNAMQLLSWQGLTNVVYSIQGTTNLLSKWTTLGKVASTGTNFGFTNWNSGQEQFYRILSHCRAVKRC